MMFICYVDESGGYESPDSTLSGVTPVMVFGGLILPGTLVPAFTRDFLALKRRHFPKRFATGPGLSHILQEVKGNEILQWTRSSSRNQRRQAGRIRLDVVDLLERHEARIIGRVWVKEASTGLAPTASYCFAIQDLARHFSSYAASKGSSGIMICDSRRPPQNARASHSVFTDKFRTGGDPIPAMAEAPVFAHSENHAGLQVADLVATTMLFPMAVSSYCTLTATGAHAAPTYAQVRSDVGVRLRALQYMYRDENGKVRGGVTVSDKLGQQSSAALFKGASS
jgi:Protein of unknown function (DUF3800)